MSLSAVLHTRLGDVIFGVLELISGVCGGLLNIVCLPYFMRGKLNISNTLYILIIITDIVICCYCIPTGVSLLNGRQPTWLADDVICTLTGILSTVAPRLSVFLVAILSIARAVSLWIPFYKQRLCHYGGALLTYFIVTFIFATLPFHYFNLSVSQNVTLGYYYLETQGECGFNIRFLKHLNTTWYIVASYGIIVIPWLIPAIIVIISSCISTYSLIRFIVPGRSYRSGSLGSQESRRLRQTSASATQTILIFTLVYIIFNVPCWIYHICMISRVLNHTYTTSFFLSYFYIFVLRLSVVFNAMANPIIYITRMNGVRAYLQVRFNCIRRRVTVVRKSMVIKVGLSKQYSKNNGV